MLSNNQEVAICKLFIFNPINRANSSSKQGNHSVQMKSEHDERSYQLKSQPIHYTLHKVWPSSTMDEPYFVYKTFVHYPEINNMPTITTNSSHCTKFDLLLSWTVLCL